MDYLIGSALRYYYFKSTTGSNYQATYSIDSTISDILVLGSSRASHHYIPHIFEDILNMSCFNTGRDGQFFLYSYAIFCSAVNRYSPKIVLFDINLNDFYIDKNELDRLSSLFPYYKEKPELRSIIELKGPLEKYKLKSSIYPFNSRILSIINGNISLIDLKNKELKGYSPLFGNLSDSSLIHTKEDTLHISSVANDIMEKIAQICDKNNIRLIMIQSPRYNLVENGNATEFFRELERKYNIEFWNYVNDTCFLKAKYFKDNDHMNDLGSHEFTRIVANRLRK